MFVVKCKIGHGKDNTYEVTDSLSGNVFIVTFLKEETASFNSFIVRDISV